jgi:hypothetical protein
MRGFRTIAIEVVVLSTALGPAAGQAAQKQPKTQEAKSSAPTAVPASEPRPGPQIEKLLRALEGTWSIRERLAPDSASPGGSTGEGKIVWRRGPGGFSVIEDYQSKQGTREVTGLGVFWWDETAQGYRTIWCDSTNPGGCINFKNVVHWEDTQLVLDEDYEIKGKTFTFKEVFGNMTEGTFTQTLYGGESGRELKVDQTIQAKRLTP